MLELALQLVCCSSLLYSSPPALLLIAVCGLTELFPSSIYTWTRKEPSQGVLYGAMLLICCVDLDSTYFWVSYQTALFGLAWNAMEKGLVANSKGEGVYWPLSIGLVGVLIKVFASTAQLQVSFMCVVLVSNLFLGLLMSRGLKNCFTFGEALMVVQLFTLMIVDYWQVLIGEISRSEVDLVVESILMGCFALALVLAPFFYLYASEDNETAQVNPRLSKKSSRVVHTSFDLALHSMSPRATGLFYGVTGVFLLGVVTPLVTYLLHKNPILWVYEFTFQEYSHLYILCYWGACLGVGLPAIHFTRTQYDGLSLIVVRKLYHILGKSCWGVYVSF